MSKLYLEFKLKRLIKQFNKFGYTFEYEKDDELLFVAIKRYPREISRTGGYFQCLRFRACKDDVDVYSYSYIPYEKNQPEEVLPIMGRELKIIKKAVRYLKSK